MSRRLWTCIACVALLMLPVAKGLAENSGRPYRDYDDRERSWRGGMEGRTLLRLHAGISTPTGDFDTAVNTGWGIGASLGYGVGRATVLSLGVAYHRFGEEFEDGHVGITPVTLSVDYGFSSNRRVRPWISGGLGLYHISEEITFLDPPNGFVTVSDSENDFGFNFGAGIAMPLSGRSAFGAGFKFHHIVGDEFPDTNFLTLQAGIAYPL